MSLSPEEKIAQNIADDQTLQNHDGEKQTPDYKNEYRILRYLLPYLWPHARPDLKRRVIYSVILLIISKITVVCVPFLYKYVVDALENNSSEKIALLAAPFFFVVAYGVARMVASGFTQLRDSIFTKVGQRALRLLAVKTFEHVHKLSLRFHLIRRTGGLARTIDRGTKGIDFLLRMFVFNLIPIIFEVSLVVGIYYFTAGLFYGHIVVAVIIVYVVFTYYVNEWRTGFRRDMNDMDNEASQKAVDSLINYETVKYFGNEQLESDRYHDTMKGYERAWIKIYHSLGILNFGQSCIIAVGLTAVMLLAGADVMDGTKTIGDFVLINTLLVQLYSQLNFLGTIFREMKQAIIDMENMFSLLDEGREITNKADAQPLMIDKCNVTFENVSFHYDPERQILKNISFEIPAGQTVAVVGPSGAGKSTLTRLLFRFYDVTDGAIKIDGYDIRDVTQESLRAAIGIVPQDTVLFNDTVGYNIAYGKPLASLDDVRRAAEAAYIHDFIEGLPDGYDTMVGERGLKLSGGEKQRVAVARTILKNPPFLIFDEATSALDTATERAIQTELDEIAASRTALIIAHRLSTVVNADKIIVLNAGEIAEQGTHEELIRAEGIYANMWQTQLDDEQL
ncbi:MAG: ABC transporter ATP-binding protein/permease, partial [Pseudomonadota bacterium]